MSIPLIDLNIFILFLLNLKHVYLIVGFHPNSFSLVIILINYRWHLQLDEVSLKRY